MIEAERRPASEVPESYPVGIETLEALVLGVHLDADRSTTVYVEWPDEMSEEAPLVGLLAALDLHPSTFADLNGERVPLRRVESRYVLDLPEREPTDRSSRWAWGVAAGIAVWVAIWLFLDQIGLLVDVGGVIVVTWLLLPVLTYFDLMYVREASDWEPNRLLWPVLAAIWLINVPAGLLYLYRRTRALGPFWR
ncbi:hypothetical protein [Natronorarus salvus]|uniref:hypothetical protein n=1 Tax=Natronorarus salvus TaxID=3117733 RepID=UPI002F26BA6B